jgi:hypothetical protein
LRRAAGSVGTLETLAVRRLREAEKIPPARAEVCAKGMTAGNRFQWTERHTQKRRPTRGRVIARLATAHRLAAVRLVFAFDWKCAAFVESPLHSITDRNYRIRMGIAIRFLLSNWISTGFRLA